MYNGTYYAIKEPFENETTSHFRERRYGRCKMLKQALDDRKKAEIETEINHYIMSGKLIIDD